MKHNIETNSCTSFQFHELQCQIRLKLDSSGSIIYLPNNKPHAILFWCSAAKLDRVILFEPSIKDVKTVLARKRNSCAIYTPPVHTPPWPNYGVPQLPAGLWMIDWKENWLCWFVRLWLLDFMRVWEVMRKCCGLKFNLNPDQLH